MNNVSVSSRPIPEGVAVSVAGELDISTAPDVERAVTKLEDSKPGLLILDLRGLTFMDSTGLRLVLGADARARREGRRVAVVPGPHSVHRVFRIALLDQRLEFVEEGRAAELLRSFEE